MTERLTLSQIEKHGSIMAEVWFESLPCHFLVV